jgi:ribose-phosphate pyrophosphokinase
MKAPLVFSLDADTLAAGICTYLEGDSGGLERRDFPDGETWLRVTSVVAGRACVIVADLSRPNPRFLPLCFLAATLREFGATQVGLVAPYLCYMRQDKRFTEGEALTARLFAELLSPRIDWLVTVDPHLHRYSALAEIYTVPTRIVHGATALGAYLGQRRNLLLVGPDAESAQWVGAVAALSGHPYVVGEKVRKGAREVVVRLPDLTHHARRTPVIVDDVIASGHTILECFRQLRGAGFMEVDCMCVHGLFAEDSDKLLLAEGLRQLASTNTIAHPSNVLDLSPELAAAAGDLLAAAPATPPAA